MVSGFSCHENEETAIDRGLDGFRFFRFALAHYYYAGSQVPGHTDIWELYRQAPQEPREARAGIGTPDQIREHLIKFEEMGVDQVVFIQQAGLNRHEHICESLELFASRVMPEFKERDEVYVRQKAERLSSAIEAAESRTPPLTTLDDVPVVDSYPVLKKKREQQDSDEIEMTEDGRAFLLSIEDGKRSK